MITTDYVQALDENLQVFLEHWGPIDWRSRIKAVPGSDNPLLARMLGALSGIEDDAFYMQTKLRYSGAARLDPVKQFNAVWLVEEADHGRALAALAEKYSGSREVALRQHATLHRDRWAIIAIPIMTAFRPYARGMLAGYLTIGMLVEYVAITTYTALAQMMDDHIAKDILLQMSRQEGRHMRFYRKGAIAVMQDSPMTQAFVRHLLERVWRPPGVELYGYSRWVEIFTPLLQDGAVRRRYLRMDDIYAELPGQQGIALMASFLTRCMQIVNASERKPENTRVVERV